MHGNAGALPRGLGWSHDVRGMSRSAALVVARLGLDSLGWRMEPGFHRGT